MTELLVSTMEGRIRLNYGEEMKHCNACARNNYLMFICYPSVSKRIKDEDVRDMIIESAFEVGCEPDERLTCQAINFVFLKNIWFNFSIEQPNGENGESIIRISWHVPIVVDKN